MSADTDEEPQTIYQVVVNHEEQYSIWPIDRDLPAGWRADGFTGAKPECLAHVDEVWTDMRPLSLRQYTAAMSEPSEEVSAPPDDTEDSLVSRLSQGEHPVEVSLRPERSGPALRDAIESGYVFVRFTGTHGGTELGIRLDGPACDLASADFDSASGRVRLIGDLTLDFEPVRCTTEIDLATMSGQGHLDPRQPDR